MKNFAKAFIFTMVLVFCLISCDTTTDNNGINVEGTLFVYAGTASSLEIANDSRGYTFPDTFLNESNEISITLKNTGNGAIKLIGKPYINLDGATTVFSVSASPEASSISPGKSVSFKIKFTPLNAVESYVYVSIPNDSKNTSDFSFTVYGKGMRPKPIATILYNGNEITQNGTINAGEVLLTQSKNINVIIRNTGVEVLTVETVNITITGADKDVFKIIDLPAQSISVGSQSQLIIEWEPDKLGGNNATLRIPTNDSSRLLVEIYFQGQAVKGSPILQILQDSTVITNNSLTPFNFGPVRVGNSKSLIFTIKNTGTIALELTGNPAVESSNPVFSITIQPVNKKLSPNETQDFILQYKPTIEGYDNAEITINNNSNETLFKVNIRGTGTVPRPYAVILYGSGEIHQDGTIDVGDILVTLSKTVIVTIRNSGDANLTLDTANITITGADAAAFIRTTTPGSTILEEGQTSFNIKCEPLKEGENRAILTIPTNDTSRNPVTVNLKMTGVRGYPVLELRQNTTVIANNSITSVNFERVELTTSKLLVFTIKNTGNIPLELTGTPIVESSNSVFTVFVQPANRIINPGTDVSFGLYYTPTDESENTGTIAITNNSNDMLFSFLVKGTGYVKKPQITIQQDTTIINPNGEYIFGSLLINTVKDLTFTIVNTGEENLNFNAVNSHCINLENTTGSYFSVIQQPFAGTVVSPGSTASFIIRFNPTVVGNNFIAAINIKTDSQNNGDFYFWVKGNGSNSYNIGDIGPGGGMIFYAQGGQYKECSGELGAYTWGNAITTAHNYRGGGFDEWHLPDRGELDLMYRNLWRNNLGGFYNSNYWSSDEYSISGYAFYYNFGYGNQNYISKSNSYYVRAVRSFSL